MTFCLCPYIVFYQNKAILNLNWPSPMIAKYLHSCVC